MNKRKIKYPDFVDEKNIKIENYGYDNNKFRFLLKVPFKTSGQNYIKIILKNPSVASEEICDMTMIKVCNATYNAGYDGVIIMNLFPYRATYAEEVYHHFYKSDKVLYDKAISTNKEIIKTVCTNSEVVFAWGTNTINKTKFFDEIYDKMANDIIEIVRCCAKSAYAPRYDKQEKHPIHALRWKKTILIENEDNHTTDEKHLVLHRNMFGPTAEVCNTNPEDFSIYCYKKNEICIPDCDGCEYFRGDEEGLGRDCEWEDFEGNLSYDESVIQNQEKIFEYDRVQYVKKCLCKKDVDKYMDWVKNYEK